jgi:Fungal specific transcription factor domain
MLSITEGYNNMWKSLVLPLVHSSQDLYLTVSAMPALHISTRKRSDFRLWELGTNLLVESSAMLCSELGHGTIEIATLATILLLAFWTKCSEGLSNRKVYIGAALEVLRKFLDMDLDNQSAPAGCLKELLVFLISNFLLMDALSSLMHAARAEDHLIIPWTLITTDKHCNRYHRIMWMIPSIIPYDP